MITLKQDLVTNNFSKFPFNETSGITFNLLSASSLKIKKY